MCVHVFIHKTPAIDILNDIYKHTIHMPYTGSMHVTYVHVHTHRQTDTDTCMFVCVQ